MARQDELVVDESADGAAPVRLVAGERGHRPAAAAAAAPSPSPPSRGARCHRRPRPAHRPDRGDQAGLRRSRHPAQPDRQQRLRRHPRRWAWCSCWRCARSTCRSAGCSTSPPSSAPWRSATGSIPSSPPPSASSSAPSSGCSTACSPSACACRCSSSRSARCRCTAGCRWWSTTRGRWSRRGRFATRAFFDLFTADLPGGIPVVTVVFIVLAVVLHVLLHKTRFGYRTLAIGSNPEAARLAGVPIGRTKIQVLVLMGAIAGLSGVLFVGFRGAVDPNSGADFLLPVIAAVIIGGTPLAGGAGTIFGTLIGVLIIAVIDSGVALLGHRRRVEHVRDRPRHRRRRRRRPTRAATAQALRRAIAGGDLTTLATRLRQPPTRDGDEMSRNRRQRTLVGALALGAAWVAIGPAATVGGTTVPPDDASAATDAPAGSAAATGACRSAPLIRRRRATLPPIRRPAPRCPTTT